MDQEDTATIPADQNQEEVADDTLEETPESQETQEPGEDGVDGSYGGDTLEPGEDTDSPVEFEEVEYEGKTYKVDPELKGALMMHRDYTQKTQEVAELRRENEQKAEALKQQEEAFGQYTREFSQLAAIDLELANLNKVDFAALQEQDPNQANALLWRKGQLVEQRQQLATNVSQAQQKKQLEAQQEHAKRIKECRSACERDIPNFSDELVNKLNDFGQRYGFSPEELSTVTDPRMIKVLNLARIGEELSNQRRKAATPKKVEPKPLTQVKGRAAPSAEPRDSDSMDEWLRKRQKQLKRAAG